MIQSAAIMVMEQITWTMRYQLSDLIYPIINSPVLTPTPEQFLIHCVVLDIFPAWIKITDIDQGDAKNENSWLVLEMEIINSQSSSLS